MNAHNAIAVLTSIEEVITEHGQSKTFTAFLKQEASLAQVPNLFTEEGEVDLEALKAVKGEVELKVTIIPKIGFGGLKLGSDKAKVNKMIGDPKSNFKKTKAGKGTTDSYGTFHVHYDEKSKVIAFEIWLDGEGSIILNKKDIAKMKYDALLKHMKDMDEDTVVKKGEGFKSVKNGIDIGASSDKKLTSIIVASSDYIKSLKGR